METLEPASISPASISTDLLEGDDATEPAHVVPPVVAVVVTTDPGPSLETTLLGLAAQDYSSLSVLVVDNGSVEDPTPRIAAAMPHAFVRRRPADAPGGQGFAAAANDALQTVEGAVFLLFCHDDAAPDPDAVRLLVEEAYRSNAGIVGPKVVDDEHPEILLEVGMAVDHYGVPFSGIEPDEVDQEQHDAVRDVFYVSHSSMLVRTDLFHELAGFDPATFPGADDVDLCWRARLAGARVVVAPAARVRQHRPEATGTVHGRPDDPVLVRDETRSRVRLLLKSYSAVALVWVVPTAFVLGLGEAIALALTGHGRHAAAILRGWGSAFAHPGELRRARATVQHQRRVDDGDVRDLMIHGSARMREFVARRMHPERVAEVGTRTRVRVAEATQRMRGAPAIIGTTVAVLVLFGVRSLLFDQAPQVGALRVWPGIGATWAAFTGSWRTTFMGSARAATPAFGLIAAFETVLVGHAGLARSLVVGGALPFGAWGVWRVVRPYAGAGLPAVAAATAYAANPIARNAIYRGELGPLVCFALAPFVLGAFLRTWDERAPLVRRVHALLTTALLLATIGAVWPPAFLLALLLGVTFLAAAPFAGEARIAARALLIAAGGTAVALVLATPWVWSVFGNAASFGSQPRAPLSLLHVVQFHTSRAGAGIASFGILAAAFVPLLIGSRERFAWAARAWMLAAVCFALAWLPGRISPTAPVPAPEGVLVGAALALAFAVGLGVAAVLDDLRRARFGWRQVLTFVVFGGLVVAMLGFSADTLSGRFGLGTDDWPTNYSWMADNTPPGGFRVLWVGDPTVLPADAKLAGGTGFATTRNGAEDARALWAAPETSADRVLGRAIAAAESGATSRLGHLIAPAGIRYVAFISRAAPQSGAHGAPQPRLADALSRQLDLTLSRVEAAGVVYQNDAWLPSHALVPANDKSVGVDARDPLTGALRSDPSGVTGVTGSSGSLNVTAPGTLLWSEAASSSWHASSHGRALARTNAFGWTNAFAVDAPGRVAVSHRASSSSRLLLVFEVLVWIAAIGAWFATRRSRTERTA
jgi:GT2 family glycosyltransferase